jgi:ParB family transcriptional regulator, chromosome partitioning protein
MTDKTSRGRGLGRGLSALMADVTTEADAAERPRRADLRVPIEALLPNPNQPRRSFRDEDMAELASSVREKGIIQPLIVRPDPTTQGRYEIVAGERRWRAAQLVQLHDVPVIVRNYTDTEVLEVAIIENIQRADLNAIDEAAAFRQLMDRFGHTQDQLATALGKSRSHVANQMRLLSLPEDVQAFVVSGELSAGHARALIGHPQASELARKIIQNKLSVRDTEQLARQGQAAPRNARRSQVVAKDADTLQIEQELAAALGMSVSIDHRPGEEGGKLTLGYRSLAQLDDLLRTLSGG